MAFSGELGRQLESHRSSLMRRALRLTRHPQDAEDLVQETYTRAVAKIGTFQPQADRPDVSMGNWLQTVQKSRHFSAHRTPKISASSLDNPGKNIILISEFETKSATPSAETLALKQAEDRAERQRIMKALSSLPEKQRNVVFLVDMLGYRYDQTAEALRIPMGSVASSLFRGRRTMRTLLTPEEL